VIGYLNFLKVILIIFPFLITLILRTFVVTWNMKALLIQKCTLVHFWFFR